MNVGPMSPQQEQVPFTQPFEDAAAEGEKPGEGNECVMAIAMIGQLAVQTVNGAARPVPNGTCACVLMRIHNKVIVYAYMFNSLYNPIL